ncbi:LCP family protein [Conexibacter sp. DBS9H8]|uniref:LCP family protein n=1 Tax=Conexibacter sp. DBS9H8 TaxID=2937801 RepID=UPI00200D0867|nr:LCP family protein [Conexibacter sp. DBS9H8]
MSRQPPEDPEYRAYRASGERPGRRGGATHAARRGRASRPQVDAFLDDPDDRPSPGREPEPSYRVYRSAPRGVGARLRGESESELGRRIEAAERAGGAGRARSASGRGRDRVRRRGAATVLGSPRGLARWGLRTWTVWRALKYLAVLAVAWVALSAVLFVISAQNKAGNIPPALAKALTPVSAPMLVSAQNVLVLGLDNRPTTGYSSHEPGSNYNEAVANTDTIMLWHVGGGVSRRLSIPRDTLVAIPGLGEAKINAAWSQSPALTVKIVEGLTGVKINHVIIVDLGNFPQFINDIGGVTVTTPRICSTISGGVKNGGYSLFLKPGSHHLTGTEALTLARTRDNSCNLAYNDINREKMQQVILNGIKSQLFSAPAFFHLPWAAWDAPGVVQTDMGASTLLQLFVSSELGGAYTPQTLNETNGVYNGQDVLIPSAADIRAKVHQLLDG